MSQQKLRTATVASPVGKIFIAVEEETLCGLVFEDHEDELRAELALRYGDVAWKSERDPAGVAGRLRAYLDGDLHALDEVPTTTAGAGTPFQQKVWGALKKIPVGVTQSYAELARTIGAPKAVRAVGAANGRNPISLVIPCHRVIASDGNLQGYGGGLDRKRWLLVHEGALLV